MPKAPAVEDFGNDSTSDTDEEKEYAIADGVVDGPNGARPYRVAYFGGMDFQETDRAMVARLWPPGTRLEHYESSNTSRNLQSVTKLCRGVSQGHIDFVYIQVKWNGHAGTRRVMLTCRQWRVPFLIVSPQGKSMLKAKGREAAATELEV